MDQVNEKSSFFQSKVFKGILYGLGIAAVLLLTFEAGVYMGYRRAMFSSQWAGHYRENFFPRPDMRFFPPGTDQGFMNDHGAFGDIVKIDNGTIVVKGQDEAEKTVLIQADTGIEKDFNKIKPTDLAVGDHVIIFGSPTDSGQIQAKFIRVLPQPISFLR